MAKKGWFRTFLETPIMYIGNDEPPKKDDYVCKKCSYGWTTKKKFGTPAFCPICRSNELLKVDNG